MLLRIAPSVRVLECDSADLQEVALLSAAHDLRGVLHAAGASDNGLLRDLLAGAMHWMFASKAVGASHLRSCAFLSPLEHCILFSSVGSGLGNVGQANYSSSNAFLDSLALTQRAIGAYTRSLQWPLIVGAGMGAAGLAAMGSRQANMSGMASISLKQYELCLWNQLKTQSSHAHSVLLVHLDPAQLFDDLSDATNPRFEEILASTSGRCAQASAKRPAAEDKFAESLFGMTSTQRSAHVEDAVLKVVSETTGEASFTVGPETPLMEAGVDSLAATELSSRLRLLTGIALSSTIVFEQPTPRAIAKHLVEHALGNGARVAPAVAIAGMHMGGTSSLTVVGTGGRWPGSVNKGLARAQLQGACGNAVGHVPARRWTLEHAVNASLLTSVQASCVGYGGFVSKAQSFDPSSFGISLSEVSVMDPQQRLVLEHGYKSLHGAGYQRSTLAGGDSGVFLGIERPDWAVVQPPAARGSVFSVTGDNVSAAAGRISFALGLQGPCASIDTACASALVALHGCAHAVRNGESVVAIALAVSLKLSPHGALGAAGAGMLSVDGRCKTLDARANGYVRSEGVGSLALVCNPEGSMTLSSSSVRQDGRSASLTAPNGSAQRTLLHTALARAVLTPPEVTTTEAHGTGTPLGDPTEMGALAAAHTGPRPVAVAVGAAKAAVGHAEAASGHVGLLRVQHVLDDATSMGNPQLRILNPLVKERLSGVEAQVHLPAQASFRTQRNAAALSAFGYTGTISHATLRHAGKRALCSAMPRIVYQRRSFLWAKASNPAYAAQTMGMYSVCWISEPLQVQTNEDAAHLLLSCFSLTIKAQALAGIQLEPIVEPLTPACSPRDAAIVLAGDASGSPARHGIQLLIGIAQQLVGSAEASRLLVITQGAMQSSGSSASSAHGGAWGFGRVLRVEQPTVRSQSTDASGVSSMLSALADHSPDPETVLCGQMRLFGRLRACPAGSKLEGACVHGRHIITGGLGGLGLRATTMLLSGGATGVVLSSRGGRASSALLEAAREENVVMTVSDVGDAADAFHLLVRTTPAGVLHAAGVLKDKALHSMTANAIVEVFVPKAIAAFHIHCSVAHAPIEAMGYFSSVSALFGNAGQANYAAANSYLDAFALTRRSVGILASSLQIPAVSGAGMGARTFDAPQLDAIGAISLDIFAESLLAVLAPCHAAVERTQTPLRRSFLDGSCRRQAPWLISEVPAEVTQHAQAVASGFAEMTFEAVLELVKETAGGDIDADTPLMEAGVDSLGEMELRNQLQSTAGVSLPSTLLTDLPTARQLTAALKTAPKAEQSQKMTTSDPSQGHSLSSPSELSSNHKSSAVCPSQVAVLHGAPPMRLQRHRVLMLHGRAADGALMERLLTALGWTGLPIDFVTVTALHQCEIRPDLYPSTVTFPNGAYDWGMNFEGPAKDPAIAEQPGAVMQSVEDIEKILATDPIGFDGIGGICDGSLIASLVAARLPPNSRVCFYINMCGGPWEMLPDSLQTEKQITLPSLHLIGKKDEMFTWDQLRSIPAKCANPLIVLHGAGHAVPLVSAQIANAVELTLQQADVLAAAKAELPAVADNSSADDGKNQASSNGGRLTTVAEGKTLPSNSGELEYDSLALLNAPKEPEKKAPLAHLTGLRGLFIVLVVILHFVPRPYENVGAKLFVDFTDVAKGWAVQDYANKVIDRIPTFSMPYLFVASGFGIHLTFRKKVYQLNDFYVDRLARMIMMLWMCVFIEFCFDRFPTRFQPYFQPATMTSLSTYVTNAITMGTFRPIIMQVHNIFHMFDDFPDVGFVTPTTSEPMNDWLAKHAQLLPTILHLWFLSFNVICVILYPAIAKMISLIDRKAGMVGLILFVIMSTIIAISPMLVDRGEVFLVINGSSLDMGPKVPQPDILYNDAGIAYWKGGWKNEQPRTNRSEEFWTDEPFRYFHYKYDKAPLWGNKVGERLYSVDWWVNPKYRLPWFLKEPSGFWLFGHILWFACGIATVAFMIRVEEWGRRAKANENDEDNRINVASSADERTALIKDDATALDDLENGLVDAARRLRPRRKGRLSRMLYSFGKSFVSHKTRGRIADACVLTILVPVLLFPLDYTMATNGYLNGFGFREFANWNRAYVPIFCLFLYGSASEGGAGYFTSLLASKPLVALGDISLAIYALQATAARLCGVRWVLRGPNQDDYCKDLHLYFRDLEGRLVGDPKSIRQGAISPEAIKSNCLNATGDQVILLLAFLLVVATFVTYQVEPVLDEKFRAGVAYLQRVVTIKNMRELNIRNLRAINVSSLIRKCCSVLWPRLGRSSQEGEREGLVRGR